MSFTRLNISNQLLNALGDLGFENPTPVQEEVYPVVMSGKDVIGIAQTGTGKTFAYMLPLLRQLKFSEQKQPRILVIVPTRELVIQVTEEINKLTTYMSVRTGGVYGGTNINTQKDIVHKGLDVLVATPGRLLDLNLNGVLRLNTIQKLVIDEVDEMLNLGFRPQLIRVLDLLPPKRQNLMFSATMTNEINLLINDFFNDPEVIEIAASGTPLDTINQIGYEVPNFFTKINLLENLLKADKSMSKVLLFAGSKKTANMIYELLAPKLQGKVNVMHGNKSQNTRIASLKGFNEGKVRVLIGTDLLARGLDIKDITHVINFDLPDQAEDYIHRIGRTGRAEKKGESISFITPADETYRKNIEELMKREIPVLEMPEGVKISNIAIPEEIPAKPDVDYMASVKVGTTPGSAFHEKSALNSKVNLGGSYKRLIKVKYTKPQRRSNNKKK